MTSTWSTHFLSFEKSCCFCGTNSLFQNSLGDMTNDLLEIASCFKEPNNLLNVFINPSSWFIFCKSRAYKSGKYNILKSLCYVKHVNLINLDPNWIQGNRSFNPGLFYLNKLHLVAKRHFVPVECISTSVGNICKIKNILQLKKANKPVPAFLINNADFPPLIFLPARDLFPDYISVLSSNSVENFLIKPTSKPFYASYNKSFCKVVCKCSISETSFFTGNECGHVSVNNIICKTHVTSDSKCTVSVLCKNDQKPFGKYFCRYNIPAMLQMVQPHLHVNILTQTLTTVLCISLFEVIFMLILILFRWLPANFVDHVHIVSSPISVTGIVTVACACHALIKRVYHVQQTPLISPRKLVFCN